MRRHNTIAVAVWSFRRWPWHVEIDAGIQSEGHSISCCRAEAAARVVFLLAHSRRGDDSRFGAAVATIRRHDFEKSRKGVRPFAAGPLRGRYSEESVFLE